MDSLTDWLDFKPEQMELYKIENVMKALHIDDNKKDIFIKYLLWLDSLIYTISCRGSEKKSYINNNSLALLIIHAIDSYLTQFEEKFENSEEMQDMIARRMTNCGL